MKLTELLLTDNVDNLGIVGDVVKVRPGYARNFLVPRGLATKPTPGSIKRLAEKRKLVEQELKLRRAEIEAVFEKIKAIEITLERSANEQGILFGGVSQHEIAQAIRDLGFPMEDRMVRIGQQIKRLDTYHIPIVMASDLRTEIKLWVVSDKPLSEDEKAEIAARAKEDAEADERIAAHAKADETAKEEAAKAAKVAAKEAADKDAAKKAADKEAAKASGETTEEAPKKKSAPKKGSKQAKKEEAKA